MLFVLPFLVMAIAFLSGYFSLESLQSVQVKGVINMAYINQLDKSWLSAIGFVMVLGVAYLIFFLSERFKLLGQTTTLPLRSIESTVILPLIRVSTRPCLHLFISC